MVHSAGHAGTADDDKDKWGWYGYFLQQRKTANVAAIRRHSAQTAAMTAVLAAGIGAGGRSRVKDWPEGSKGQGPAPNRNVYGFIVVG